jgi:hypothetical protein
MHFETILDQPRQELLPFFKKLPLKFYLSEGTGLALQFGHRKSVDFDFFIKESFDTQTLLEDLSTDVFTGIPVMPIQEAENTLDILLDSTVKVSFLRYRYPLVFKPIKTDYFMVADYRDIGAMKLIAAAQRASQKDYFDLYYILQSISLSKLFEIAQKKYPSFNPVIYLKALTYFDDCEIDPPTGDRPASYI